MGFRCRRRRRAARPAVRPRHSRGRPGAHGERRQQRGRLVSARAPPRSRGLPRADLQPTSGVLRGRPTTTAPPAPNDWGKAWQDVVGAVKFVESRGARHVAVGGSSVGHHRGLRRRHRSHPSSRADLARRGQPHQRLQPHPCRRAPDRRRQALRVRTARRRCAAASAREFYRWARAPRMVLLGTDYHGTDMFAPPPAPASARSSPGSSCASCERRCPPSREAGRRPRRGSGSAVEREAALLDAAARSGSWRASRSGPWARPAGSFLATPRSTRSWSTGRAGCGSSAGTMERTSVCFPAVELRHAIERILAPLGRRVDEAEPLCDARVPDAFRVSVADRHREVEPAPSATGGANLPGSKLAARAELRWQYCDVLSQAKRDVSDSPDVGLSTRALRPSDDCMGRIAIGGSPAPSYHQARRG